MSTSIIAKRARLAAQIERDLLRPTIKPVQLPSCFACGRAFIKAAGRFCSIRCRTAFDAGFQAYEAPDLDRFYSLPKGVRGFLIDCAHCRKRFDSKGLRCCASDCERAYRQKQDLDTELADDVFRVVKRECAECGGNIPNWRKGRRVSTATKFCCARCRERYRTTSGMTADSPPAVLPRQTAKKCPENGPRRLGGAATSTPGERVP